MQNQKADRFSSDPNRVKYNRRYHRSKTLPNWAYLSLVANALLMLTVILLLKDYSSPIDFPISASTAQQSLARETPNFPSGLGPRHQLTYNRWMAIMKQEANAAAQNQPEHLTILAGDSLSMWFPTDLLPKDKTWLNQGISGETTAGLLKRLKLFDRTQPETIFVMIGINDLIRGYDDDNILSNQRLIIQRLRRHHPEAQIVVQSILPHGGEETTWEGRSRLLAIPNSRIQVLNEKLAAIASEEGIQYLDLYPLFSDEQGNLRPELTTDGLHLSRQGYLVWQSALMLFDRLKPPENAPKETGFLRFQRNPVSLRNFSTRRVRPERCTAPCPPILPSRLPMR
ncbi:SGNH/GDSL hydrolase family protein [Microseira wollei]|uniref:Lipolytic enzyme, G-D-S-L n=1 Tax=Microseira wollei NIES-4236 TaxID=2530354 RepID=A0AAV3XT65_9CYAN|nr:SGNH/GDSL hydrolase family protein [Microseira wollei]GET43780.1 lipolytic enzyme, G-D-S-L [Microseira wollei NIES-4236]